MSTINEPEDEAMRWAPPSGAPVPPTPASVSTPAPAIEPVPPEPPAPEPHRAWLGGDPLGGIEPPPPAPVIERRSVDRRRAGGVIAAIAGAGLVLGSFLPWVRADMVGMGVRDGSGWRNVVGNLSFGPGVTAVGVGITFLAVAGLVGLGGRFQRVVTAVLAAAAVGGVAAIIVDVSTPGVGVETDLAVGIFVMAVAAVLAVVGSALGAGGRRSQVAMPRREERVRRAAIVPGSGAVGAVG